MTYVFVCLRRHLITGLKLYIIHKLKSEMASLIFNLTYVLLEEKEDKYQGTYKACKNKFNVT